MATLPPEPAPDGVGAPLGPAVGERRIVSVLVTDIVDSTGIAERLGSERSKVLFDEVARAMAGQVRLYGGTLAQHTGDGVLAVFGAPVAHGDDAERAVRAALGAHAALQALADEMTAAYGLSLTARAAVNTGPAAVPVGEQPPDVLYNALGDTVNVAARLQAHADPGGVVVGPVTAAEVDDLFVCEPLGDLVVRGRAETVAAYRVLGERPEEKEHLTPYVGRDGELAALVTALEDVAEGSGAVVVVTGEAGIGKSRLIAEALASIGDRIRVLEGHGVSYAEHFPYWPVRGLLRDWLGVPSDAPEAQIRLELRAALNGLLGTDAEAAYPFLAPVARAPLDPTSAARLREQAEDSVRQRTVESLLSVVVALSRQRPLVLVLDDLHWADEASLQFVTELLGLVDEEALGLVLSYRTEREHPVWRLGERANQRVPHRYWEVELPALPAQAASQLAAGLAGATLPAEADALLARRAGGNPFFLEQALHDLMERGTLSRTSDGFELGSPLDAAAIPFAVQETLQARLDRLAADTREVVTAASVLGRTFSRSLLSDLLGGRALAAPLSELQRLDLVVETRRRPDAEYRFRHGLVQEVAYASLLEDRRRALHRRAAELLETVVCCDDDLGLLGHHWAEAGDLLRASVYLIRAGDAARRIYADSEALEHYERALGYQRALGDDVGARETLLRLALARHQAYDFAGADAAWRAALSLPHASATTPAPTETLVVPISPPDSLVPGVTAFEGTTWVSRHVFTGLLRAARGGGVVPEGAETLAVSPDGRTYRFALRPTARWHDGTPVTAGDYAFAHRWIIDHGLFGHTLLGHVESVTAVDDLDLEVRLRRPLAHLPYLLSVAAIFPWPRHLWVDGPPALDDVAHLVGNGPFRLVESDADHLLLAAADTWDRPRGNVSAVRMPVIRGEDAVSAARAQWRDGAFDLAFDAPDEEEESSPDAATVHFAFPRSGVQYLGFATRGVLIDVRVRRALVLALPDALDRPGSTRARGGFLPPAALAHSHDLGIRHDVAHASALLAEAGYPGGAGLAKLRLAMPAELDDRPIDPEEIVAAWAEIGVQVEVVRPTQNAMKAAVEDAATHAWVFGWMADSPDSVGVLESLLAAYPPLVRPDGDLQSMLDRAAASTDRDERNALCRQFERGWIAEQAALRPLTYIGPSAVARPYVHGFWTGFAEAATADELVLDPQVDDS